jgi:hypothetical protein
MIEDRDKHQIGAVISARQQQGSNSSSSGSSSTTGKDVW